MPSAPLGKALSSRASRDGIHRSINSEEQRCRELRHREDSNGQYKFDLKAGNGEIIASSELYTTKASAQTGTASIKTNAAGADVVDETSE